MNYNQHKASLPSLYTDDYGRVHSFVLATSSIVTVVTNGNQRCNSRCIAEVLSLPYRHPNEKGGGRLASSC